MTLIKYGIRSVLRSRVKTALFVVLITAVTLFISLGAGVWTAAENMLDELDDIFSTVGEVIYSGAASAGGAASARDDDTAGAVYEALEASGVATLSPEKAAYEPSYSGRAYIGDFRPLFTDMPFYNYTVLVVQIGYWDGDVGAFSAIVLSSIYSELNQMAVFVPQDKENYSFEAGRKYIIFGYTRQLPRRSMYITLPTEFEIAGFEAPGGIAPVADVTDLSPEGRAALTEKYEELGELLHINNRSVEYAAASDLSTIGEFHRSEYTFSEGRLPLPADGEFSCAVSHRIASQMDIGIGDTIRISFHDPAPGAGYYNSYNSALGYAFEGEYVITGIYQSSVSTSAVYIPYTGQGWLSHNENDEVFARIALDNRTAEAYAEEIRAILPAGSYLDLYDQGYAHAARPVLGMRETGVMIILSCILAGAAVLFFFGYLFVHRGRENIRVMKSLGTKTGGIQLFFLSGGGLIALLSACLGGIGGWALSDTVTASVYASAAGSNFDYRFSISKGAAVLDTSGLSPTTSILPYLVTAGAVVGVTLLVFLIMTGRNLWRQNPRHKARRRPRAKPANSPQKRKAQGAGFTLHLPTVTLRYATRSALRGGARSAVIPLLFAVMIAFLSIFANIRAGYEARLATVYEDIPVRLYISDITGRKTSNLAVDPAAPFDIESTGFTEETYKATRYRFMFVGTDTYADGTRADPLPPLFTVPTYVYALETFLNQISFLTDPAILTNDIAALPMFRFSGMPTVTFMEGYDLEQFYAVLEVKNHMIVPESFLLENDVQIGDKALMAAIYQYGNGASADHANYTIVGSYPDVFGETIFISKLMGSMTGVSDEPGRDFAENHLGNLMDDEVRSIAVYPEYSELFEHWILVVEAYDHDGGVLFTAPYIYTHEQNDPEEHAALLQDDLNYWRRFDFDLSFFSTGARYTQNFDSLSFLLKDTENLSAFRDYLDTQFDQVGARVYHRGWVVIDDSTLYSTIDNLTRYIGYMDFLYPVIMALVAGMGFLVSHLLLKHRTGEINILLRTGTSRVMIFRMLFVEQVLLALPSIIIVTIAGGQVWSALMFAGFYFVGAGAAVTSTLRASVMSLQHDR